MFDRFRNFVRGLATNWIGSLGVALTTAAFLIFVFVELLRILGVVTGSYSGLVTYLTLPALFILGLLLIPIGWRRYRIKAGRPTTELLRERFRPEMTEGRLFGAGVFQMVLLLTVVNLLFLGGGTARMLHFMEEPRFCGTACHDVMGPEWATYQASPHANVHCVDCHVGEGFAALVDSKINGLWQVVSRTFDLYERPIPTPVHQLRPARETCEQCHWPDKFYGDRIVNRTRYAFDAESTPAFTTLSMKVGSGKGERRGEIHWHVAENNAVRYASIEDKREKILWTEALQPDGSWRRFTNKRFANRPEPGDAVRTMDCVDCHNRATHIFEDPENAIDDRLQSGVIDPGLPWIKREAMAALTAGYADPAAADAGISNRIRGFYLRELPDVSIGMSREIDAAVASLQAAWRRNIHPGMNVGWGVHPDHLGHRGGRGCFRCHDSGMIDEQGTAISSECTLCHSILAYDSDRPFRFLAPADTTDAEYRMHVHLQDEFLGALEEK